VNKDYHFADTVANVIDAFLRYQWPTTLRSAAV